ncbi:hypothetical protein J2755_000946 [Methanohalophilus levihalophilus]|nr:hypothetical protein [Methanohalophilus levihalophilus]MBP2030012.1 hypothetical protein [Methanohalophilus levihalophilus]
MRLTFVILFILAAIMISGCLDGETTNNSSEIASEYNSSIAETN